MIIAVAAQKGGCSKTTTVVNLAAAFAERGARVLVVDLDAQAHASYWLRAQKGGTTVHSSRTGSKEEQIRSFTKRAGRG